MKQPDITSAAAMAVLKTLSAQKTMDMTPADIARRDLRLQAIERLEFDQESLALAVKSVSELRTLLRDYIEECDVAGVDSGCTDALRRARIVLDRASEH